MSVSLFVCTCLLSPLLVHLLWLQKGPHLLLFNNWSCIDGWTADRHTDGQTDIFRKAKSTGSLAQCSLKNRNRGIIPLKQHFALIDSQKTPRKLAIPDYKWYKFIFSKEKKAVSCHLANKSSRRILTHLWKVGNIVNLLWQAFAQPIRYICDTTSACCFVMFKPIYYRFQLAFSYIVCKFDNLNPTIVIVLQYFPLQKCNNYYLSLYAFGIIRLCKFNWNKEYLGTPDIAELFEECSLELQAIYVIVKIILILRLASKQNF